MWFKLYFKILTMKKLFYIPLLICNLIFLGCEKNDDFPEKDSGNYQTPLPAVTNTGTGTFACYVDGKAYIAPKNGITAYYQFYQGSYGLTVRGRWEDADYIRSISLEGNNNSDLIIEGATYTFGKRGIGIQYYTAGVFFMPQGNWFNTKEEQTGELKITKFDEINGILSGTFWFDVKRPDGKIVEIRDGRFDVKYAG